MDGRGIRGSAAVPWNLHDVEVLVPGSDEHVRICGLNGTVLFRDNGVWSRPKSQTSDHLFAVSFLSPDEGYAVGAKSLLLKYE